VHASNAHHPLTLVSPIVSGQFSTGKTTFIEEVLLETHYPGSDVRPDPSTHAYTLLTRGTFSRDVVETGASLVMRDNLPLKPLRHLGRSFLNHLTVVQMAHTRKGLILDHINVLDTPGVLSQTDRLVEQRDSRDVWHVIANLADMVVVMLDVKSADFSNNMLELLAKLAQHEDKIVFLLNKADSGVWHMI
jgi:GTPase SAR1 family protein